MRLLGSQQKVLTPQLHAVLDYVSVGLLALAPSVFGLAGPATLFAYVLADVHSMTLFTASPAGVVKVIPLPLHGLVEIIVGVALTVGVWLVTPLVNLGVPGRTFYSAFGVVLIIVWLLTDYRKPALAQ
jgi:hypothetical protein